MGERLRSDEPNTFVKDEYEAMTQAYEERKDHLQDFGTELYDTISDIPITELPKGSRQESGFVVIPDGMTRDSEGREGWYWLGIHDGKGNTLIVTHCIINGDGTTSYDHSTVTPNRNGGHKVASLRAEFTGGRQESRQYLDDAESVTKLEQLLGEMQELVPQR